MKREREAAARALRFDWTQLPAGLAMVAIQTAIRAEQRKAIIRALEIGGGVLDDEGIDALLDAEELG